MEERERQADELEGTEVDIAEIILSDLSLDVGREPGDLAPEFDADVVVEALERLETDGRAVREASGLVYLSRRGEEWMIRRSTVNVQLTEETDGQ